MAAAACGCICLGLHMPRYLDELPAVVDSQELLHLTSPNAPCLGAKVEQVKLGEKCAGEATVEHVPLTYHCNQPTEPRFPAQATVDSSEQGHVCELTSSLKRVQQPRLECACLHPGQLGRLQLPCAPFSKLHEPASGLALLNQSSSMCCFGVYGGVLDDRHQTSLLQLVSECLDAAFRHVIFQGAQLPWSACKGRSPEAPASDACSPEAALALVSMPAHSFAQQQLQCAAHLASKPAAASARSSAFSSTLHFDTSSSVDLASAWCPNTSRCLLSQLQHSLSCAVHPAACGVPDMSCWKGMDTQAEDVCPAICLEQDEQLP